MVTRTRKELSSQFAELAKDIDSWQIPEKAVDTVHDMARASLNEVKALTEYEDNKVSRLLTVVAFLSAVVGAVFTRFESEYVWPSPQWELQRAWVLPFLSYLAFLVYLVVVTAAVFVLIQAIRPRFKVPASWTGDSKAGPSSMVFYEKILDVSPRVWGSAFIGLTDDTGKKLKSVYAKCYIKEAYLVADKIADKLRYVDPGVSALK